MFVTFSSQYFQKYLKTTQRCLSFLSNFVNISLSDVEKVNELIRDIKNSREVD